MSRHHYEASREMEMEVYKRDWPYYSIIMCAMRRADSTNLSKLRLMWPDVFADLEARYNAPGGILPGDPPWPGDYTQEEEPV